MLCLMELRAVMVMSCSSEWCGMMVQSTWISTREEFGGAKKDEDDFKVRASGFSAVIESLQICCSGVRPAC